MTSTSSVGMLTVTRQESVRPLWEVAVMMAMPSSTPVITPSLTVATVSSLVSQVKSVSAR